MLLQSNRLKRSLLKISDVQEIDGKNYYKFNLQIFLKHLKHKTMSIYQALNNRYEKMDSKLPAKIQRTFMPQDRNSRNSTSKKQEVEIDEKIDQNLLTLATGFIVDEIP